MKMSAEPPVMALPPELPFRTIREVGALTGMSKSWIYGEMRSGRLRTVMVGGRRMIPANALAEWLDSLPRMPQ